MLVLLSALRADPLEPLYVKLERDRLRPLRRTRRLFAR
jgi:hypothetical protein